jgi:hypothetical protein
MKKPIFLICTILIIACEKEGNDFPKNYTFDSFETGKVRIFTNDGEIQNEQLCEDFIDRWGNYFYKKDSFRFDDFDLIGEITLNSNNQSILQGPDTTRYYGFKRKGGVVYFESSDTSYSIYDLINMKDRRFMYGPITQTDVKEGRSLGIPPITTYYGYLQCVYAIDNGDELRFPFTSFLEKNCNVGTSWSIVGDCSNVEAISNVNNLFNESYLDGMYNVQINTLYGRRDTVVIQENFIVFRKN